MLFLDEPVREINTSGGITGVTPFLLPRDYDTSSASVVPRETAAPISPRVTGSPVVPSSNKPRLTASSPLAGPSYSAGEGSGSSSQRLLSPEPSVLSSTSGSGSQHRGSSIPSWHGSTAEETGPTGSRERVQSPKGARTPHAASTPSPGSSPPQSRRRQPNVYADSGLRFPLDQAPLGIADEVSSQAPTEYPPAYTPS